jgi:protein TonB
VLFSVDGAALDDSWNQASFGGSGIVYDGAHAGLGSSRLALRDGEPFEVSIERPGERWKFGGTAHSNVDGTIALDAAVEHNAAVVGRPRLLLRDGETGGMRIGEETADSFRGLAVQITLASISDPKAIEALAAAQRTAAESAPPAPANPDRGATYRSMHRIAYPAAALAAGVEGVVYVRLNIGVDGSPTGAIVDHFDRASAGALATAAVDGIRIWRFNPAHRGGVDVASVEVVPIVFALNPDAIPEVSGGTLDAIRVGPPDDATATGADRPPAEDIAYRKMFPPVYPPEAIKQRVTGNLMFKIYVDDRGTPQSVDVFKSEPPEVAGVFAKTSIDAIMRWRFNPGVKDGKPSAGDILVPITFSLDDE